MPSFQEALRARQVHDFFASYCPQDLPRAATAATLDFPSTKALLSALCRTQKLSAAQTAEALERAALWDDAVDRLRDDGLVDVFVALQRAAQLFQSHVPSAAVGGAGEGALSSSSSAQQLMELQRAVQAIGPSTISHSPNATTDTSSSRPRPSSREEESSSSPFSFMTAEGRAMMMMRAPSPRRPLEVTPHAKTTTTTARREGADHQPQSRSAAAAAMDVAALVRRTAAVCGCVGSDVASIDAVGMQEALGAPNAVLPAYLSALASIEAQLQRHWAELEEATVQLDVERRTAEQTRLSVQHAEATQQREWDALRAEQRRVTAAVTALERREATLQEQMKTVQEREQRLAEQRNAFADDQRAADERAEALYKRESALRTAEKSLGAAKSELGRLEEVYAERVGQLVTDEEGLRGWAKELEKRELSLRSVIQQLKAKGIVVTVS